MVAEPLTRMERLVCKGFDPKSGRPCKKVLLEVWPDHKAEVLKRVVIKCHDCKTVYEE